MVCTHPEKRARLQLGGKVSPQKAEKMENRPNASKPCAQTVECLSNLQIPFWCLGFLAPSFWKDSPLG